jgi:hypothetical protein
MAFSSGTYTLPGPALSTGDTVSATENNTLRNDMASSFNLTWLRNGTAAATANIPMGGFELTNAAAIGSNSSLLLKSNSGTTAVTIDTSQNATFANRATFPTTIGVGGTTPSTSGAGISFPATQSASSDANTLDDYEEGTWTPSLGGSTTYQSAGQAGTYTKIGRIVNFKAILYINAIGTGSTTQITGLPFAAASGSGAVCAVSSYGGIATSVACVNLNIAASTIYCQSNVGNAVTNQTANAIFANSTYFEFSGTYQTT